MTHDATWFRRPEGDDPGTGNAAYNAVDRHVIRGRADEVAVVLGERSWTYADLLAESAALAGALRAVGVEPGDAVVVGRLPETEGVLVLLAVARLGAMVRYADDLGAAVAEVAPRAVVAAEEPGLDAGDVPVVTVDGSSELSWEVLMRAGRTDPAGCADVPGDAVLAVMDERDWTLADALGVAEVTAGPLPVPEGVELVELGGARLWIWRR